MVQFQSLRRVVAVANAKGGVGKTTTVCNIAGLAAYANHHTLLIDCDPQGNVGHVLGYAWRHEGDGGAHLAESILRGTHLTPPLVDVRDGLDVIPCGSALDEVERALLRERRPLSMTSLAEVLAPIAGDYDLILIDTPPTRPALLELALAATRWVLIPSKAGRTSIEGLRSLVEVMSAARTVNPHLEVLAAFIYDVETRATTVRRNAEEDITNALGGAAPLLKTVVRHATAPVVECEEKGQLLYELAEKEEGRESYWAAIRKAQEAGQGRPERSFGSAPALSNDLVELTDEVLKTIVRAEKKGAR